MARVNGSEAWSWNVQIQTVSVTLDAAGSGVVDLDTDLLLVDPDFQITVLDTVVRRAPSSIVVTVDGGRPEQEIQFFMDSGDPVSGQALAYTTTLDVSGSLQPTSLTILADLGGQQGTRTLTAVQTGEVSATISATATYTVQIGPQVYPISQGSDAQAVEIPGALTATGRNWVLQDLLPAIDGGIGSYVMPVNPTQMSSPHLEFALTTHHTTAMTGKYHVFQAGNIAKEWTFSGMAVSQEMVEMLQAYYELNRRFYTIDHRNRAWKTVWTNLEIVPRLRTTYNGEVSDWITDYTVTAIVLDQNWVSPA